jgi:hypothetical protein
VRILGGYKEGDQPERRVATKKEMMFEVIHPNNSSVQGYPIEGVDMGATEECAGSRNMETLEAICKMMRREEENGRLVAPHVRFVRLVKCEGMR